MTSNDGDAVLPPGLLPIPTVADPDLCTVLADLVADPRRRIDIVCGPDDAGKSTLLRHLAPACRRSGLRAQLVDLSLVEWRELLRQADTNIVLIDHLDRIPERDQFQAAFTILDRVLPAMFASGLSRLILAYGAEWRRRFQRAYRVRPESLLRGGTPGIAVAVHEIRPFTSTELADVCKQIGLTPEDFDDPALRCSGVLAMASELAREHTTLIGSVLRDLLAHRWIETANDASARIVRQGLWDLMGTRMLLTGEFALGGEEVTAALGPGFTWDIVRAQIGGPLRWEDNQVQSDRPAWSDVAGARALRTLLTGHSRDTISRPPRTSVLKALVDISDRGELKADVHQKLIALRGNDFASSGYLGPVIGTLSAQLSADAALIFQDLSLQGPDPERLRPIGAEVATQVEQALVRSMEVAADGLFKALRLSTVAAASGYHGGYECWQTARRWAAALPLRASAENAALNLLPADGSWRYEDILDVSVTGATTRFMSKHAPALASALAPLPDPLPQYLADVWDGVNDGAWDQIDSRPEEFVSALSLPDEVGRPVNAVGCRMQRAHFGEQDADGWRLVRCDLLLADFRSCRNVERTDFTGSNWWSAILPPPARYHHSRLSNESAFRAWCASPPWTNPFFTGTWPHPFD
ncbi:ATP-binding protein [Paractinoplanes brasiliensis]|uniref:Uncharacterized protein n=1 Tax=Paractinoplanes brasiliensis TaxID=52695 RepID=A0A4R6JAL3_9ACTN|nr:ATP-binding protein [Actinoplanes brasiliensis]TDO32730.1 hypothetical protein C8E87_8202 [Actinoplanes brasiliensis]GID31728.1 hypothetical protein Abr02nite_67110 [Actinoplanes brasiliensis]